MAEMERAPPAARWHLLCLVGPPAHQQVDKEGRARSDDGPPREGQTVRDNATVKTQHEFPIVTGVGQVKEHACIEI